MLFMDFVSWWYGDGWIGRATRAVQRLRYWADYFSIGRLLITLFSPWKQIVPVRVQDRSFDRLMSDYIDSLVSRLVGFWVRLFVIMAGVIGLVMIFIISIAIVIIWPLLPVLPLLLIVAGSGGS